MDKLKQLTDEEMDKLNMDYADESRSVWDRTDISRIEKIDLAIKIVGVQERIRQAAHDNAIRQVIEWGEEDCPHGKQLKTTKQFCPRCWQELKESL